MPTIEEMNADETAIQNNSGRGDNTVITIASEYVPDDQMRIEIDGKEFPVIVCKTQYKPDPSFAPFTDLCRKQVKQFIANDEVMFFCKDPKKQIIQIIRNSFRIANLCNVRKCILSPKIGGQCLLHVDKCWEKQLGSTAKLIERSAQIEASAARVRRQNEAAAAAAAEAKGKKKKFKKWPKPKTNEELEMAEQEERAAMDHTYLIDDDIFKRPYRFTKQQKVELNTKIVKTIESSSISYAYFNKDSFADILQTAFNVGFWAGKNYPQRAPAILKNEVYHRTYLKKMLSDAQAAESAKETCDGGDGGGAQAVKRKRKNKIAKRPGNRAVASTSMTGSPRKLSKKKLKQAESTPTLNGADLIVQTIPASTSSSYQIFEIPVNDNGELQQMVVVTAEEAQALEGGRIKAETVDAINILQNMNQTKWY